LMLSPAIACYRHMQSLTMKRVDLRPKHIDALASIARVDALALWVCAPNFRVPANLSLQVKFLWIQGEWLFPEKWMPHLASFATFLTRSRAAQKLRINIGEGSSPWIRALATAPENLQMVKTVCLQDTTMAPHMTIVSFEDVSLLLRACRQLEGVDLRIPALEDPSPIPATLIQHLHSLGCMSSHLPIFRYASELRSLCIFDDRQYWPRLDGQPMLLDVPGLWTKLESLSIVEYSSTISEDACLGELCTNLIRLQLTVPNTIPLLTEDIIPCVRVSLSSCVYHTGSYALYFSAF
jgi:hypothetical protein